MIEKLSLEESSYKFKQNEINFSEVNYIYGTNGTGKTTITRLLESKAREDGKNIKIFDGYRRYLKETGNLYTIVLGEESVEHQKKIEDLQKDIASIELNLDKERNGSVGERLNNLENELKTCRNHIDTIRRNKAREIKKESEELGVFHKGTLAKMFPKAEWELSSKEYQRYKTDLKAMKLSQIQGDYKGVAINFKSIIKMTNDLLAHKISISSFIDEFLHEPNKAKFASRGMEIHKVGDTCSFCGNLYTEKRKEQLESIFSNELDKFKDELNVQIRFVENEIKKIESLQTLNHLQFYKRFHEDVSFYNQKIKEYKENSSIILKSVLQSLKLKKENMYTKMEGISFSSPLVMDYKSIRKLINKNKEYHKSLEDKIHIARKKIQQHMVYQFYYSNEYQLLMHEEKKLEDKIEELKVCYKQEHNKLKKLETRQKEILLQFSTDYKAIKNINDKLKTFHQLGFQLEYQGDDREGEYCIQNYDGRKRKISSLSEGEKNFIAFLWFIEHLEDVEQNKGEKIVVFDDPMSSNDSYFQYLMISEIRNIVRSNREKELKQIFILTHNPFFYKQVINSKYKKRKFRHMHLYKKYKESKVYTEIVLIENKENDIRDMYEDLWLNFVICYEENQRIVMWNLMRRILETYSIFYYNDTSVSRLLDKIDASKLEYPLALELVKALHINSHSVPLLSEEVNLKDVHKDDMLNSFKLIFEELDALDHFETYTKSVKNMI